jgi:hypothetical protein
MIALDIAAGVFALLLLAAWLTVAWAALVCNKDVT